MCNSDSENLPFSCQTLDTEALSRSLRETDAVRVREQFAISFDQKQLLDARAVVLCVPVLAPGKCVASEMFRA